MAPMLALASLNLVVHALPKLDVPPSTQRHHRIPVSSCWRLESTNAELLQAQESRAILEYPADLHWRGKADLEGK